MVLAYQQEIDQVVPEAGQCPPATAVGVDRQAWHWVAETPRDGCFLPQAVKNPPRLLKARDFEEKCSCWAISMHASYASSIAAFHGVEKSFRRARKIFGGYVARADLTPQDGLCTPVDQRSHFDFHPFTDYNFILSFSVAGEIP
jgi:hypothetical protein